MHARGDAGEDGGVVGAWCGSDRLEQTSWAYGESGQDGCVHTTGGRELELELERRLEKKRAANRQVLPSVRFAQVLFVLVGKWETDLTDLLAVLSVYQRALLRARF